MVFLFTLSLHKKTCQGGLKRNNNKDFGAMRDYSWKSPNVNSRIINVICHVFYPPAFAKASARQVGKADDTASPLLPAGPKPWRRLVKDSRYVTTASPLTPRISPIAGSANSILDFCSVRVPAGTTKNHCFPRGQRSSPPRPQ
jgi:hypothetical protein